MAAKINYGRIKTLSELIGKLGLKTIYSIEDKDKQLEAMKKLYAETKHVGYVCLLAISNALISYRLSVKGEEYWLAFSRELSKTNPSLRYALKNIVSFLKESSLNVVNLEQKISRLRKLYSTNIVRIVFNSPEAYAKNITMLWKDLSKALNADPKSKTIVFSIKMFYYAYYASTGKRIKLPMEIPIPVDFRISTITLTSGLLTLNSQMTHANKVKLLLSRYSDIVRSVWKEIGERTNIPPLNLDALIWVFGKHVSFRCSKERIINKTLDYLQELFEKEPNVLVKRLVYEFFKYY